MLRPVGAGGSALPKPRAALVPRFALGWLAVGPLALNRYVHMKTGKERKPSRNIHRQQLFYWMGRGIDDRNRGRKLLSYALVGEVLGQLRGSLERGLWVKRPRFPETMEFQKKVFPLDLPIACLTEWSLGESLPHTAEYGRIGLRFPKRWAIERGGQSVMYFRPSRSLFTVRRSPFTIRRSSTAVRRSSLAVRRSSLAIRRSSLAIRGNLLACEARTTGTARAARLLDRVFGIATG